MSFEGAHRTDRVDRVGVREGNGVCMAASQTLSCGSENSEFRCFFDFFVRGGLH